MTEPVDTEDVRWTVVTVHDGTHDVGASYLSVTGGALTFFDREGHVLTAYGPGFWKEVSE